jgi:HAE1 family hydrophobic/amphiphilic exporter-1
MLLGTVFGLIIIPGLYVVFATLSEKLANRRMKERIPLTEENI